MSIRHCLQETRTRSRMEGTFPFPPWERNGLPWSSRGQLEDQTAKEVFREHESQGTRNRHQAACSREHPQLLTAGQNSSHLLHGSAIAHVFYLLCLCSAVYNLALNGITEKTITYCSAHIWLKCTFLLFKLDVHGQKEYLQWYLKY